MRNILYISSSPRHSESYSKQVAQDVIDDLRGAAAGRSM
jgi:FMN-dependent NADH-azoreductase